MHCTYASICSQQEKEERDRGEAKAERRRQHEAWGAHSFRVEYGVRLLASRLG